MRCIFVAEASIFALACSMVLGQSYENATSLRSALLAGYHKDIRPLANQSHIVNVNVSLVLYGLPVVDDVAGTISLVAATQCTWMDERMTWDPSDYGGISKILILKDEVWTPSISLGTPVKFATLGKADSHVTFYSNGLAFYFPGDVLESSCTFNMRFWPFDKQVCTAKFFPMDYTLDQVLFSTPEPKVNSIFYVPNSEWTLEGSSSFIDNKYGYSAAGFSLKLKRQSLFYVLTLILPLAGIGTMAGLVFILPKESGERISYAVTIMLALAVFLTVVSDEMPKTSEPISLLCVFIFMGVMVSVAGSFASIYTLILYYREESVPKGAWYMTIFRLTKCASGNKVNDVDNNLEQIDRHMKLKRPNETISFSQKKLQSGKSMLINVRTAESRTEEDDNAVTWKDISVALDKVVIFAMIVFAYIPSVIFMIYIGCAADYQESQ